MVLSNINLFIRLCLHQKRALFYLPTFQHYVNYCRSCNAEQQKSFLNGLKHLKGSFSLFQTGLNLTFTLPQIIFYFKHVPRSCLKEIKKYFFISKDEIDKYCQGWKSYHSKLSRGLVQCSKSQLLAKSNQTSCLLRNSLVFAVSDSKVVFEIAIIMLTLLV